MNELLDELLRDDDKPQEKPIMISKTFKKPVVTPIREAIIYEK